MIHFDRLFAVARAEIRLTRRLVRYWVFVVAAALLTLLAYLQVGLIHGLFSTYSSTIASMSPHYLTALLGVRYLLLFTIGVVFLGFDIRARDVRERMHEVLDSRPFTNLELLGGRMLGLLLCAWVPMTAGVLFVDLLGAILRSLRVPFGEAIEPLSLLSLTVVMAVPTFVFAIGLVFLVTLLVRNRVLAAVLLLAIIGGCFWGIFKLPLAWGPLFDIWGAYIVDFPSDIIPTIATAIGWSQRFGVLLAGLGLLVLATAVHPRRDDGSPSRRLAAGAFLALAGLALMANTSRYRFAELEQIQTWRVAHEAVRAEAVPDITAMVADVTLHPGSGLEGTVELSYRAPAANHLERAIFTLNPGLEVNSVVDGAGREVKFSHENGLLVLDGRLDAEVERSVTLEFAGRLHRLFGYIDGAKTPESLTAMDGAIFLLGFDRVVDDRRHVAMLPGVRWLPTSGGDIGRDNPAERPRDYFEIELEVEIPSGWLPAAPGLREEIEAVNGGSRFRFRPGAPVDGVALIAGRFNRYAMEVAGVPCELLLHPGHERNLETLSEAMEEIRTAADELLSEAADVGLAYPYSAFTMVEVPTAVRGYGGGWRLDTAMAPPGMLLMRETGLPAARFDTAFRKPEKFADQEGGVPRAMRDRVRVFFLNDFSGGNLFAGTARSLFLHQTSASGPEGLAVNFALEELTSLVFSGERGYFSAHFFDKDMGPRIQSVMTNFGGANDGKFADTMIDVLTSRPEVWEAVLGEPLAGFDPWADPERTLDALTLKAGAMSRSLYDALGRERVAGLLAELRRSHSGTTFTFADLVLVAEQLDPGVGAMLEDWMQTTTLPAFVGVEASAFRLPDGEDGGARYQILAEVRNDESPRGLFRFSYRIGDDDSRETIESDPITIDGHSVVRWGTVVSRPPMGVWVEPYLSLNRESFRIVMADLDEGEVVDAEPVEGIESMPAEPPQVDWIVVDDLDPGFSVVTEKDGWNLRLLGRGGDRELDTGLPVSKGFGLPSRWSRADSSTAWGAYRHTVAFKKAGTGNARAQFKAEVPKSGSWELEIHLCHKERFRRARKGWGTWKITVADEYDSSETEFDAGSAPRGWNQVGDFELANGEVTVTLSDESSGQVVVADAIRWVPRRAAGGGVDVALSGP